MIEFKKPGTGQVVFQAKADQNGHFESARQVEEGYYCFKASLSGWQSVVGMVLVTGDAEADAAIVFKMPHGV